MLELYSPHEIRDSTCEVRGVIVGTHQRLPCLYALGTLLYGFTFKRLAVRPS